MKISLPVAEPLKLSRGRRPHSGGANPRRRVCSLTTRVTRNCVKYSSPPAFVPTPESRWPPNGWRPTSAPVIAGIRPCSDYAAVHGYTEYESLATSSSPRVRLRWWGCELSFHRLNEPFHAPLLPRV